MKRAVSCLAATLALTLADNDRGLAQNAASPTPAAASPAASAKPGGATFEERLHNAETVKVITEILGIEIDSELDEAHEKLEQVSDPKDRPKEEKEENKAEEHEDHREIWKLTGTDYSEILLQADDKEKITRIVAALRPDKLLPFAEIGDLSKAPILNDNEVAWDVLRPGKPLIRLIARGAARRASTLTLFLVRKRQQTPEETNH